MDKLRINLHVALKTLPRRVYRKLAEGRAVESDEAAAKVIDRVVKVLEAYDVRERETVDPMQRAPSTPTSRS